MVFLSFSCLLSFFVSSHYTTPAQCWVQDLARGLNSSRSSSVHGCGRMGQTSRCFIVCSSPHSHAVCPSSLYPHFCVSALHRPVPFRRRLRLDQMGPASFRRGGSYSSGLKPPIMYWYLTNNMTLVFDRCKHQLSTAIKLLILIVQSSIYDSS